MSDRLSDDVSMSAFLDWYASHNTLIIQSLAALIALLIVFFIFRLFFVNQESTASVNGQKASFDQLETKLNKLLDQQALLKTSMAKATQEGNPEAGDSLGDDAMAALSGDPDLAAAGAAAAAAAAEGTNQVAELSRLRAEISTLKDSLKRKEVEIITAKEQASSQNASGAQLDDLSGKISDYEKQIETLKNRLSDYEIIAEDIADLQRYKKENQELKSQLSGQAPTNAAEPMTEPEPELEAEPEPIPEPELELAAEDSAEPKIEGPDDIFAAAQVALENDDGLPALTVEDELNNEEAKEVSKDVRKEDRKLLDDFEKHFAKDDD